MQGKRIQVDETQAFKLQPGEYAKLENGVWFACAPNGLLGDLSNHEVVEHDDGTITVSPSLLISGHDVEGTEISWHGYLERGAWREL